MLHKIAEYFWEYWSESENGFLKSGMCPTSVLKAAHERTYECKSFFQTFPKMPFSLYLDYETVINMKVSNYHWVCAFQYFSISWPFDTLAIPSFKSKYSWYLCTFHLFALWMSGNIYGKKRGKKRREKIMPAELLLLLVRQETKKHTGFAWKKCCISRRGGAGCSSLVFHTSADLWVTHST